QTPIPRTGREEPVELERRKPTVLFLCPQSGAGRRQRVQQLPGQLPVPCCEAGSVLTSTGRHSKPVPGLGHGEVAMENADITAGRIPERLPLFYARPGAEFRRPA